MPRGTMAHLSDSGTGSKSGVRIPNRATVPAPSCCQRTSSASTGRECVIEAPAAPKPAEMRKCLRCIGKDALVLSILFLNVVRTLADSESNFHQVRADNHLARK